MFFLLLQEPGVVLSQNYQNVWHLLLLKEKKSQDGMHLSTLFQNAEYY